MRAPLDNYNTASLELSNGWASSRCHRNAVPCALLCRAHSEGSLREEKSRFCGVIKTKKASLSGNTRSEKNSAVRKRMYFVVFKKVGEVFFSALDCALYTALYKDALHLCFLPEEYSFTLLFAWLKHFLVTLIKLLQH